MSKRRKPHKSSSLTGSKAVPHHHESIPGSHDVFDYAFFDTRFYKLVQVLERAGSNRGMLTPQYSTYAEAEQWMSTDTPDLCLSTEMTPSDAQDFESWYRAEHLKDGSKVRGWRRTERYELINALRAPNAPGFLTLVSSDMELRAPCNADNV